MKKIVAVIPARSGSVRIPHKNLSQINGVPLLAIAVQQALSIAMIDEVYISTDSEIYAQIAQNYGAIVPFIRPAELARSNSTDYDVLLHFLNWYRDQNGCEPELIVQIRPTAPARDLNLIGQAIRIMLEHPDYDSLRSVSMPHQSPYKMWSFAKGHQMSPVLPSGKGYDGPTQELPASYAQDGVVDIIRPSTLTALASTSGNLIAGILNTAENWDIDHPYDLERASEFFKNQDLFGLMHGSPLGGNLGLIQGRLTVSDQLQCFPEHWEREFASARICGYHCIELIRDITENEKNPLWSQDDDVYEIRQVAKQSGVGIRSVCDDYVQQCDWTKLSHENYKNLISLLIKASRLGVSVVVYPLFVNAELSDEAKQQAFLGMLGIFAPLAERLHLQIALEISADASHLRKLFRQIPWQNVGLCFDTGNLRAAGIDMEPILKDVELCQRIMHVHLKDRDGAGKNVVPGSGTVNFSRIFALLKQIFYSGLLITETDRGTDPIQTAVENRKFFSSIICQQQS